MTTIPKNFQSIYVTRLSNPSTSPNILTATTITSSNIVATTSTITNSIFTNITGGALTLNTGLSTGNIRLNSNVFYFRNNDDINHGLQWNTLGDGPKLWGWLGGTLAYGANGANTTMLWNGIGVGIFNISPLYSLDVNGKSRVRSLDINGTQPSFNSSTLGALFIGSGKGLLMGTTTDVYPEIHLGNYGHDNIPLMFDMYYDNTDFRISYGSAGNIGIGYSIYKQSGKLTFNYATGLEGSIVSYTAAGAFGSSGNFGLGGQTIPAFPLDVSGTARITTSLTSGALYSTNLTSSNIVATTATIPNIIFTNVTCTSLLATTSISSGALFSTNITSTNIVGTTSTIPNSIFTNVTTSNLNVIGNIKNGGFNFVSTSSITTGSAGTLLIATNGGGLFSGRIWIDATSPSGGHSTIELDITGTFTSDVAFAKPSILIKRSQYAGNNNVFNLIVCTSSTGQGYLSNYFLTCAASVTLNIRLLESVDTNLLTLTTPALTTLTTTYTQATYPLTNSGIMLCAHGNYLSVNDIGIAINTSTPVYKLDVGGTIASSGIRLPRFHNGTFSAASSMSIPIYFGDTEYNYVEIKVKFTTTVDAIDTTFAGNTLEDGTGTTLNPSEQRSNYVIYDDITHTFQGQNSYKIAVNAAGSISDYMLTFRVVRSSTRCHFEYTTVYTYATVGTTRLVGQGYLDSTSRSLKISPASGNISGTYSTVHSY
jgi:hypothetical protein